LEAALAKFSAGKLVAIVEQLVRALAPGHGFRLEKSRARGWPLATFSEAELVSADEIDSEWLRRIELRSLEDVADYLEARGFHASEGKLAALFLDNRCGLIRMALIAAGAAGTRVQAVRQILDEASNCHAHGIILATFDPRGALVRTTNWSEFSAIIARKAEAMGICLLSHLALTSTGWRTIAPSRYSERSRTDAGRAQHRKTNVAPSAKRQGRSASVSNRAANSRRGSQRGSSHG
jgi:hypothetical protein